jgi:hypothetical protein
MSDETRLTSELTDDNTYKNSIGSEVAVIKITNDILMTNKEMAKVFGVQDPVMNKNLKRFFPVANLAKNMLLQY